jgi:hypothetical protein
MGKIFSKAKDAVSAKDTGKNKHKHLFEENPILKTINNQKRVDAM